MTDDTMTIATKLTGISNELTPTMPRYLGWLTDEAILQLEKLRGSKFVGEFPLKEHSPVVGALFYQPDPPPDYSNYFFLYLRTLESLEDKREYRICVTSGAHMVGKVMAGVRTKNGDFIYSRGRHDCIELDGSMVDGGDSYLRCNAGDTVVRFKVEKDKLIEVPLESTDDR